MNDKFPHFKFQKEYFIILLPIFFILHGFTENYYLVPIRDALILLAYYSGITIIFCLVFFFAFKSLRKSIIFTFFLMAYHFFFGSIHDTAKRILGSNFFTSYLFVLTISIAVLLLLFVYLKKNRTTLAKTVTFLNVLFLIFCCLDSILLIIKIINKNNEVKTVPAGLSKFDKNYKPDVYLIIADEYAGIQELKEVFNFDNSEFTNTLISKGFHIINGPRSNYNFTPFSVASILNFSYLPLDDINHTSKDIHTVMDMIKNNQICNFYLSSGYKLFNNSYFDLPGQPTEVTETFLPTKTTYITSQTFLSRVKRDIAFNLISRFKMPMFIKEEKYFNLYNNKKLFNKSISTTKAESPKFSYTHLMMPHFPFYFDKKGNPNDYNTLFNDKDKDLYLEYLKYSNNKFIVLIDEILKNSRQPPIILFMSDHGFREKVDTKYLFMNFCAVYLPDKKYGKFYDGISGVNVFRILLNTEFNQSLPLLPDSSIILKD